MPPSRLGPQVSAVQGISGGTILPDGRVVLILDVPALVTNRARRAAVVEVAHDEVVAAPMADERQLVMVVDDSITIRRVTERLLTRAGYRVVLAKDPRRVVTGAQARRAEELWTALKGQANVQAADGISLTSCPRPISSAQ